MRMSRLTMNRTYPCKLRIRCQEKVTRKHPNANQSTYQELSSHETASFHNKIHTTSGGWAQYILRQFAHARFAMTTKQTEHVNAPAAVSCWRQNHPSAIPRGLD